MPYQIAKSQNVFGFISVFDGVTKKQEWISPRLEGGWGKSLRTFDIDADGVVEIVAGAANALYVFDGVTKRQEWKSQDLGYLVYGLTVGDVDVDRDVEIVCANQNGHLYVFDGRTKAEDWREDGGGEGVSVADLDADGVKEIVAGSAHTLYTLNGVTKARTWVNSIGAWVDASEAIDVDQDGQMEVVVLTSDGYI